ncbi:hypothetical protein QCN29_02325 [Streptomyces sp. HNM0663]|uniref:Membrane transport protein MMPL domain-containing protein n=1 Tax=Streptomyces chengmaiensis TaxID=3040919 RepID=A0ABT6HFV2_9ACTN|nr:hypothetical protein [Streptomyces chengmaiensis]MDH2387642.1 hypothetical protein [Streptomyces chengmaiensis]
MSQPARRTVRTVTQTVLGLAAGLPLIIDAASIPQTAAGVGLALAITGGITRVMALPVVDNLLPQWLRAGRQ